MGFVARVLIVSAAFCCLPVSGGDAAVEPLDPVRLVGVWEQCYEPGFPGISEIDQGFLVLEPKGRYKRIWQGQDSPVAVESGQYELKGAQVVFTPETRLLPDGTSGGGHVFKPWTLRLMKDHSVEFWRNRGKVVETDVLTMSGHANYAYARVL